MTRPIKASISARGDDLHDAAQEFTGAVMSDSGRGKTVCSSVSRPLPNIMDQIRRDLVALKDMDIDDLRSRYRLLMRRKAPSHLPRWLLLRIVAYRLQASVLGDLDGETVRYLDRIASDQVKGKMAGASDAKGSVAKRKVAVAGITPVPYRLRPGTLLVREHNGELYKVTVMEKGFSWNGQSFTSLSEIARTITGTSWNGPAFFGLRSKKGPTENTDLASAVTTGAAP